jgi:hypothetical protein
LKSKKFFFFAGSIRGVKELLALGREEAVDDTEEEVIDDD